MNENFPDIIAAFKNGVRLTVKARPRTSRDRPSRIVAVADGQRAVEVAVAAITEDGKANRAIIDSLARQIGVAKADLVIKSGASGRLKVIEIRGDAATLHGQITAWLTRLTNEP